MPGKKITDHQVHKYKDHRKTLTQVAAAAKAGLSEGSARRIERSQALPSQKAPRSWRTRSDPLADIWEAEVVPLLQTDPLLNAVTLLEELQSRHPGQYGQGLLRTLRRRMRQWRALYGAEREVFFAQEPSPGARPGLFAGTSGMALRVPRGVPRQRSRCAAGSRGHATNRMSDLLLEQRCSIAL